MINDIGISQTLKINEYCKTTNKKINKLGFGQSPFEPPDFFKMSINENIDKNDYLPVQGLESLRESIADHYKNFHNVNISKDDLVIGPGSKLLIFQLSLILDEIYFVSPYWVSYINQLKLIGKNYNITNTTFESKWKITLEQLREHKNNSYLFLNFPNNPTGQTYSKFELEQIVEICREKNICIISDEIYQYLNFNNEFTTLLELYPENTIVLNGLSKWCHSGGYRLGYIIFPKSLNNIKKTFLSFSSETFSSVNTPLQYGAVSVFKNFDKILLHNSKNIEILKKYNNFFYEELLKLKIKVHKASGGFYLFLDFSYYKKNLLKKSIMSSEDLCTKLLEDCDIALLPGNSFGIFDGYTTRLAFTDFKDLDDIDEHNINFIKKLSLWLKSLSF